MQNRSQYALLLPRGNDGQRALCLDFYTRSAVNPLTSQTGTALFGGTITDGTYSIVVTPANDTPIVVTVERVGAVPLTDANMATAMVAALNLEPLLNGILEATVNGGTPEQVDLAFVHSGIAYAVTTVAPSPGTLVHTLTQAAGGIDLPVGRWVARGAAIGGDVDVAVAVQSGDTLADLLGYAERPHGQIEQSDDPTADDVFPGGMMVSCGRRGVWLMECENAFTVSDSVFVRLVAVPAEGTHVGGVRAGSGTSTLDISTIARFLTAGAAGELAEVEVFLA